MKRRPLNSELGRWGVLVVSRDSTTLTWQLSVVREGQWLSEPLQTISIEEFRTTGKEWLRASLLASGDNANTEGAAYARLPLYPRLSLANSVDGDSVTIEILHQFDIRVGPAYFGEFISLPWVLSATAFADGILAAFDRCASMRLCPIREAKVHVHLIRRRGTGEYYWCEWQPVSVPGLSVPAVTSWGDPVPVDCNVIVERGREHVARSFQEFYSRARDRNPLRYPSAYLIEEAGLADQQMVVVYIEGRTAGNAPIKIQPFDYAMWDEEQTIGVDVLETSLSVPAHKFGEQLLAALDMCAVEEYGDQGYTKTY